MDAKGGNGHVFEREPIPMFFTVPHRAALNVELRHMNRNRPAGAPEYTLSDVMADWLDDFFAMIAAKNEEGPPRILRTAIYERPPNVVELDPWTPRR